MSNLNPVPEFASLKSSTIEAIRQQFPVVGRINRLELVSVEVQDAADKPSHPFHIDNVQAQSEAKINGMTWAVPIKATLRLIEISTGKVLNESTVTVGRLPKITRRYTYIIDGHERQHDSLFRSKARPYHIVAGNGQITARWNVSGGRGFDIHINPAAGGRFTMKVGSSNIPLYAILKALGTADSDIEKAWGKKVLEANKVKADITSSLVQFHKAIVGGGKKYSPIEPEKAAQFVREYLETTTVRPDAMVAAFGKPFTNVNKDGLLLSSTRLLNMSKGKEEEDDRQALSAKDIVGTSEFIVETIQKSAHSLKRKIMNNLDRKERVADIFQTNLFNKAVTDAFRPAQRPDHPNPLGYLSGHLRTTIRSEEFGGIKSEHTNLDRDKLINATHLGFLDPLQTPECWPEYAEVFTARGWVRWGEVADDDQFLCRTDEGTVFAPASKIHRSHYEGELYCMDQGKISYAVTPSHRMWVSAPWAKETWRFAEARSIHGKERRFDTGHEPVNVENPRQGFLLPSVEGNNSSKNVTEPIPMTDWAEFMGWFLSEGSFYYREDGSRHQANISQKKLANPVEYERIQTLLERLPFNWHPNGKESAFSISTKQLANYLRQFGKAQDKFIPEFFFETSTKARKALLEALLLGDGKIDSKRPNGRSYKQRVYTTSSSRLAQDVDRLATTLGYAVSIKKYEDRREERYLDIYEVRLLHHRYRTARPANSRYPARFWLEKFSGTVYCATVPGGLLYCRMPGRVAFWSGNSSDTGVALHLPLGVKREGTELKTKVYNTRTNKLEWKSPGELERAIVAYPDQVRWPKGFDFPPTPLAQQVTVYDEHRETSTKPWKDVEYVLLSSKGLFSFSANLIPFLQNNSGNRAQAATKQQEQAVSLEQREAPLVQTKTDGGPSFEQVVGSFNSHRSPVDGVVTQVTTNLIEVRAADGKIAKISTYDHFPLNGGHHMMHSEPTVKVGDRVRRGQLLADTNFTRDGQLSLGTNLRVAYIPYKGLNFEDGIVVSEAAAKKLTSMHLYQESLMLWPGVEVGNLKRWRDYAIPERATPEKLGKLDTEGIIRVGEKVQRGDILVAALAPDHKIDEDLSNISRKLRRDYRDVSLVYDHDAPGTVAKVVRGNKKIHVHVRSHQPLVAGDKLAGRHGNKGIVSRVLPNHEMPKDKDGNPVHILLNPIGVNNRMNIGQVLETAASKIARKTGQPFRVDNFKPGTDYSDLVKKELKKHKLSDTEELFDPKTGKSLGNVLTGDQYILKLHHLVDKKVTARSYGGNYSSVHGAPPSGSGIPGGGQALDQLTTYAMLAHGAKHNLREAFTFKSDVDQFDVWTAIQRGDALPPPQPARVLRNFMDYMRAMGINTEKQGDSYVLSPMTDKHTEKISRGVMRFPEKALQAKGIRTIEEAGGLFDPKVTGGLEGKYWSHIKLSERVPNPLFEKPISVLLGLKPGEFEDLTNAKTGFKDGKSGFDLINERLSAIDVDKELAALEAELPKLSGAPLAKAYKKTRYLRALKTNKLKPVEAYTNQLLPVVPPNIRKVSIGPDGSQIFDDLNPLYKFVGQMNEQLRKADKSTPPRQLHETRAALYDSIRALRLDGMDQKQFGLNRHFTGLMEKLKGDKPKTSFFQAAVMSRRQDLSARSTIIPAPELKLDEVALPTPVALEMYKPFVVRELHVARGIPPMQAQELIKKKDPAALEALETVIEHHPVLMKRDPVLHKFSIMAFKPRLTGGKAIGLHPLVTGGYNADYDGDSMAIYLPVSTEAIEEAKRMMPSKNLFSPTHFGIMPVPAQDSLMGMHQLTEWGKEVKLPPSDQNPTRIVKLLRDGKLRASDVIPHQGRPSTAGRIALVQALPQAELTYREKLLYDKSYRLDKGRLKKLLDHIGKTHPDDFGQVADAWKDLSVHIAFHNGSSFGIDDFHDGAKFRDAILKPYFKQHDKLMASSLPKEQRDKQIIELWSKANKELEDRGTVRYEKGTNRVYDWKRAGAMKGWSQFAQTVFGPILVNDAKGSPVPLPITKSWGEGLSLSQYWTSLHGARKGTIDRSQNTRDPGALTKDILNTVINQHVTSEDCRTTQGALLATDHSDCVGRHLVQVLRLPNGEEIAPRTLLTPDLLAKIKKAGVQKIVVRTPLHCKEQKGVCSMCFGHNENAKHHAVGTNIGVIAGHSLGEPVTQLQMRCNASGNLLRVRMDGRIHVMSMEQLWDRVPSRVVRDDDGVETKSTLGLEVWDQTSFVKAYTIQRHEPDDRMVFARSKNGFAFVSQGNHPNWARSAAPACPTCGSQEPVKFVEHWTSTEGSPPRTSVACCACNHAFSIEREEYEAQQERIVFTEDLLGCLLGTSEYAEDYVEMPLPPYLMGMCLAEGSVRRENRERKGPVRDRILAEIAKAELPYFKGDKSVELASTELGEILPTSWGDNCSTKQLPPGFMAQNREWKLQFLAGLFDGNGTVKDDCLVIDTTSWALASQTLLLLKSIGARATVYVGSVRKTNRNQPYKVFAYMPCALPSVKKHPIRKDQCYGGAHGYSEIVQTEEVMYSGYVYDVATETRGFSSNGMRTHNTFHTGGAIGGGGGVVDGFKRALQLFKVPKALPGSAVIAMQDGTVQKVVRDVAVGGHNITVSGKIYHIPTQQQVLVRVGEAVKRGQPLCTGPVNPHELLKATSNIQQVRAYLTDELEKVYETTGTRRRNIETVVRAMTNLARIDQAPDHPEYLRGQTVPMSEVEARNDEARRLGKRPITYKPLLQSMNDVPLSIQEDWMARLNYQKLQDTYIEGAAQRWESNIHDHPIPGLVHGAEFGFNRHKK